MKNMSLVPLSGRAAGQERHPGAVFAHLLHLAEDGVRSLDLSFAQLPQGHLLKVDLRREAGSPLKAAFGG